MQTKEITFMEVKSSRDEINNILIAHVQKHFGIKIESTTLGKDGVIIFKGTKSKDVTAPELLYNGSTGASLADALLGKEKKARTPREPRADGEVRGGNAGRKNSGLTKWLRGQLAEGHKIHVEILAREANLNGFDASEYTVEKYMKQGTMKKDFTEVNKGVFQLTEVFKNSHNRESVAA